MEIKTNQALTGYNTFGVAASARRFLSLESEHDIIDACRDTVPSLILGGGSNVLFTSEVIDEVWHIDSKGKRIIHEEEQFVLLQVEAGENWHELVCWCIQEGYGGIENLSLIPGRVGAAPIQNIGAYGVEVKDVINTVHYIDIDRSIQKSLHHSECHFEYRNSIFKQALKSKVIISSVVFRLSKPGFHILNMQYGAIQSALSHLESSAINIKAVSDAIIQIRQTKLPNPDQIGNAGSFFKNPIIDAALHTHLRKRYPAMPSYTMPDDQYKIPAAWLIDQAGWKGKKEGQVGSYQHQALVLVNHGQARGQEIYDFSEQILQDIKTRYEIHLEREVNII